MCSSVCSFCTSSRGIETVRRPRYQIAGVKAVATSRSKSAGSLEVISHLGHFYLILTRGRCRPTASRVLLVNDERSFMRKFLGSLALGAALMAPVALAQVNVRVYTDTRHHDTHEWNNDEDQRYRSYLVEHHQKYREFSKTNRRDQDAYWNYRHQH